MSESVSELQEVRVPDIGDFDEVDVIDILVNAGDHINIEDPLISLESDKATMEVPSPVSGIIAELKVAAGDKVSQGSLIATIAAQDTDQSGDASGASDAAAPVIDNPATIEPPAPKPAESSVTRSKPQGLPPPVERSGGALSHASPAVRRFARELGADLKLIRGTGPKSRILKEDIQNFVKSSLSGSGVQTTATGNGIEPIPAVDFSKFGETEQIQLSRIKRISGPFLTRAWLNVPHVTHHDEADVTDLESFRRDLKAEAESQGVKLTPLVFVIKALVASLRAFPNFNASLAPDGQNLILKKYFHIGIAVDTPGGLVVPVVRDVDSKGIFALSAELAEISGRARDGKLKPDEMQGGCMSISSLGGIGGTAFTPIVNAPEVAILGLTRARVAPSWDGSQFVPRTMLPIDLSYDHRVIDGAEAARFVAFLAKTLGDIRRLTL